MGYVLGAVIVGAAIVLFGIYVISGITNKKKNDDKPSTPDGLL